eukprot:gene16165-22326_t
MHSLIRHQLTPTPIVHRARHTHSLTRTQSVDGGRKPHAPRHALGGTAGHEGTLPTRGTLPTTLYQLLGVEPHVISLAHEVLAGDHRQLYDVHGLHALTSPKYLPLKEFLGHGVTIREAGVGAEKVVRSQVFSQCLICEGLGTDISAPPIACACCHGSGEIRRSIHPHSTPGTKRLMLLSLCPGCNGSGAEDAPPCTRCNGEGRTKSGRGVRVKVPPGAVDGSFIRVRGLGHVGRRRGPGGDWYVKLMVSVDESGVSI